MKAFIIALVLLTLGDFAMNHGNGTHQVVLFIQHFAASASHAVSGSVFNQ